MKMIKYGRDDVLDQLNCRYIRIRCWFSWINRRYNDPLQTGTCNLTRNKKTSLTEAYQTRYGPPPRVSSVDDRLQSDICQCSGLCCCHTFTYALNILKLPLIRNNIALPSTIHRRTTDTRLNTEYDFPTLPLQLIRRKFNSSWYNYKNC